MDRIEGSVENKGVFREMIDGYREIKSGYQLASELVKRVKQKGGLIASGINAEEFDPVLRISMVMDLAYYMYPVHTVTYTSRKELKEDPLDGTQIGILTYDLTHKKDAKFMRDLWKALRKTGGNNAT